jgi:hypothetical protein
VLSLAATSVSWGTKGDNVVSLGTVSTSKSGEVVAVVPDEKDRMTCMMMRCTFCKPKEEKKVNGGQQQEDYYRNVRTKYVDFVVSFSSSNLIETLFFAAFCLRGFCQTVSSPTRSRPPMRTRQQRAPMRLCQTIWRFCCTLSNSFFLGGCCGYICPGRVKILKLIFMRI